MWAYFGPSTGSFGVLNRGGVKCWNDDLNILVSKLRECHKSTSTQKGGSLRVALILETSKYSYLRHISIDFTVLLAGFKVYKLSLV